MCQEGTQLSAALLPVSALPRGYQLPRNPRQLREPPGEGAAKYHLATMSWATYYDAQRQDGFGETAFAEDGFDDVTASHGTGFFQQVYQFPAANAARSFT
jgi:hypothetical protein